MRLAVCLMLAMFLSGSAVAQDEPATPPVKEMVRPKKTAFQVSVLDAVKAARKKGEMSARQALKIRVAMLSPAFQKRAEDLAVTQMAFSGTETSVPRGEDGKINRAAIDWGNLLVFLEKLLPFILELIDLFAVNGNSILVRGAV